ncbi:MAG: MurR/RpiR family transcriptional regulator [Anaerolineaceae bacterium]|jgi:DNA-binding MurR/RpiR family transcriptional regulator
MNALELIANKMGKLSKTKKRLAEYILANWENIAFLSASQLSKEVKISESVIVRFAYQVGFDGYPAMQDSIQELVRTKLSLVDRYRSGQSEGYDIQSIHRSLNIDLENLRSSVEHCSPEEIIEAVNLISNAGKIVVLAARSSAGPALILSQYLNEILGNTHFYNFNTGDIYDHLRLLGQSDLVIAISFSWYTRQTIEAVDFTKKKGASVLTITDNYSSPLVQYGDVNLFVNVNSTSFFVSHVGTLGLIHILLKFVSQKVSDRSLESLSEMQDIYKEYYVFPVNDEKKQNDPSISAKKSNYSQNDK